MAAGFPTKANWVSGDILTAAAQDDLAGTVNLLSNASAASGTVLVSNIAGTSFAYQPLQAAGKNAIINGGMDIWQRGTSVALAASSVYTANYTADRWQVGTLAALEATTISRQATADTTNLPNIQYCARVQRNSGQTGIGNIYFGQSIESTNSIPFAGKTVVLSFYARAGANYSAGSSVLASTITYGTGTDQNFNAGYTGGVLNTQNNTLTTTWQKFTYSLTIPATATEIGTYFTFVPIGTAGANDYFEITGVQLELGSVATTFSRAGGTLQGELANCQRYYWRQSANATNLYADFAFGTASATTNVEYDLKCPVSMRITPTSVDYSLLSCQDGVARTSITTASITALYSGTDSVRINSAATGLTQYRPYFIQGINSASAYIGLSAEL